MATTVVSASNLQRFKTKQDAFNDSKFAKKGDLASLYRLKGSVAFAELPADAAVGDVYNVSDRGGMNYVWDGSAWDALGNMTVAEWDSITGKPESFPASAHTHTKAQITDFPAALKNPSALTLKVAGANAKTYDGSAAVELDVTLAGLGAAAESHDHAAMTGATASAAGKAGFVPAPAAGANSKFLRGDGTWVAPENTTYADMGGASASAAGTHGLVPAPAAGKQASFLRGDGTWAVPTDTTYSAATQSAAGLMSAADKAKLDGVEAGATKAVAMTDAEVDALFA